MNRNLLITDLVDAMISNDIEKVRSDVSSVIDDILNGQYELKSDKHEDNQENKCQECDFV